MSMAMTSMPSLLRPQRLVPLKKKKALKRRQRVAKGHRPRAAEEETKPVDPPSKTATTAPTSNSTPSKPSTREKATATLKTVGGRIWNSMTLIGGTPELLAGRCAMVAIPTVFAYEMIKKEQFLSLVAQHKFLFASVVGLIALATVVPVAMGAKSERIGFMTPYAELINGRAAMIGIIAIVLLEAKSGENFF